MIRTIKSMTEVYGIIDQSTTVRRYLHGDLLSTERTGETSYNVYDTFARVVATSRAEISFTLILDCDEGVRLKSAPKKTGDWALDGQNWHRAFGEGLAPRASGTAIELLP